MVYNSISCTIGIHPMRTSQFLPRAYQSQSKNTPNLTIHFQTENPSIAIINSKSSIVCTNCFSTICKPFRISDPEILVYWTYQEWEGLVRLPVGDIPRPSLTSIAQNRILSPLHSVTHVSYRLLTFERGIPYILSNTVNIPLHGPICL